MFISSLSPVGGGLFDVKVTFTSLYSILMLTDWSGLLHLPCETKTGMKGISADVLSIAWYNRGITFELVRAALSNVSCQTVEEWQQHNVCPNRYGLRKRMGQELKSVG